MASVEKFELKINRPTCANPVGQIMQNKKGKLSEIPVGVPISRIPLGYTMITPGYFDFFVENTNCVL